MTSTSLSAVTSNREEFLSSLAENVSSLISSLNLKVSNKEVYFAHFAIVEWVKQDPEEHNHHLPTLLSHACLPVLSISYLMEKVEHLMQLE